VIAHPKFSTAAEIDPYFDAVRKSMELTVLPAHAEGGGSLPGEGVRGKPHIISVYGADRPGIVYSVARELAGSR